jgi:hypothetical protein
MTGHAHHFLSRLDRLARPHVELALSLYNDVELLRFVLHEVGVPEGVARVAVCLGPPEVGPHLVVTREGRFVTALGEGMRPFDVTVVSREALEHLGRRVNTLRERLRASESLTLGEGHAGALLRKISRAGPHFHREDYLAIAGLHPFLARTFLEGMVDSAEACMRVSNTLHQDRRMRPKLREEWLRLGWDAFWSLNHFTVLLGTDWGWNPMRILEGLPPEVQRSMLHWPHVRLGCFPSFARGLWFAGRCGAPQLDSLTEWYVGAQTRLRALAAGVGLIALACRNPERLDEIRAVLSRHDAEVLNEREDQFVRGIKQGMERTLREDLDAQVAHARDLMALIVAQESGLGPDDPITEAETPFLWCALSHRVFDVVNETESLIVAVTMAPALARLEPEDFFMPRAIVRDALPRWSPALAERVFLPRARTMPVPQPVRAAQSPGRNDPCHCGSGKKFKHCCLAKAR